MRVVRLCHTAPLTAQPIPVVKQIMKDLLVGDSAKAELKLTEVQLVQTEKKKNFLLSIIFFPLDLEKLSIPKKGIFLILRCSHI